MHREFTSQIRRIPTIDGVIPERTLGLVISRSISGGMHEDLDITNNSMKRVRFQLEIALRCDFADIFEVKSGSIVRRGRITTKWSQPKQQLRTVYRNGNFRRAVTVAPKEQPAKAVYANGRVSFEVDLDAGEAWHCCLLYTLEDGKRLFAPLQDCADQFQTTHHAEALSDWLRSVLKIRTSNEEFYRLYHQALEDMAALRLPITGTDHMVFLPAAGLPWFVAPFGRDSLDGFSTEPADLSGFRSRHARHLGLAPGTRRRTTIVTQSPARYCTRSATASSPHFKLIPHTPYYGTADATPLYLITLHAAWRATGDKTLVGAPSRDRRSDACPG